jgi:hypothetical protein
LRAAASVAGKPHVNDFRQQLYNKPQFHRAGRRQFQRGTYTVGFGRGDRAMWIIWYIAMVASLRAMGLPNVVPVRIDEDRTPFGDL